MTAAVSMRVSCHSKGGRGNRSAQTHSPRRLSDPSVQGSPRDPFVGLETSHPTKCRARKIRPAEVGFGEIGIDDLRILKIGLLEVCAREDRTAPIGAHQLLCC
jgi:hypothetical protein